MILGADDKSIKSMLLDRKKTVLLFLQLSLTVLVLLGAGLAPIESSAQSMPSSSSSASPLSNLGTSSPFGSSPTGFPPPPISPELSAAQKSASTKKTCTLTPSLIEYEGTPQQTEGPYFVDGIPNRSDITSDPSDGSVQQGIPLHLIIHVYGLNENGSCTPLKGAKVDIWHANSQGIYSDIADQGTIGKKFLRGYQLTDNNGIAKFTTIYPGWYQGRAIHIHDKVRTYNGSEKTLEWTSQLYFDNSINAQVHKQPPYSKHGPPDIANEQDGIYAGPSTDGLIQSNTGKHLMVNLTKGQGQSYNGIFNIVLNATQQKA
jgi:protocatechuate 3,4-dioxygenase beta subunit